MKLKAQVFPKLLNLKFSVPQCLKDYVLGDYLTLMLLTFRKTATTSLTALLPNCFIFVNESESENINLGNISNLTMVC